MEILKTLYIYCQRIAVYALGAPRIPKKKYSNIRIDLHICSTLGHRKRLKRHT